MGVGIMHSFSRYDAKTRTYDEVERLPVSLPNPKPDNYIIKKSVEKNGYLLIDIVYPDCTNYEGRKFLLYRGVTLKELESQKLIDPHFSESMYYYSPIARFEPTKSGWEMALDVMNYYMR